MQKHGCLDRTHMSNYCTEWRQSPVYYDNLILLLQYTQYSSTTQNITCLGGGVPFVRKRKQIYTVLLHNEGTKENASAVLHATRQRQGIENKSVIRKKISCLFPKWHCSAVCVWLCAVVHNNWHNVLRGYGSSTTVRYACTRTPFIFSLLHFYIRSTTQPCTLFLRRTFRMHPPNSSTALRALWTKQHV